MKKILCLAILCLTLTGCNDEEEHGKACVRWGAKVGSPDYIHCMATMAKNQQLDEEQSVAIGLAVGMSSANTGSRR